MASQTTPKKPQYQSKKRALEEADLYEITKVIPVQECYVDKETLQAYNLAVFTGSFKASDDAVWTVTILPSEFWQYHKHKDCLELFAKLGLKGFFALPAWGMDVKRCHQLLTTLTNDGEATIDGPDNQPMTVSITEDLIKDALKVNKGTNSLISRNSQQENMDTFLDPAEVNQTFKDIIKQEIVFPLRIYTQHFTHGKAVRYTRPHKRITAMFAKAYASRGNLSLRFSELILTELKGFATRFKNNRNLHMNCCHMMTRICYYAVGMIEELPPPIKLKQWLEVCTAPPPITVKPKGISAGTPTTKKGRKTRSQTKAKRPTDSESSAASDEETEEEEVDSEKTDTDDEIKKELQNKPAISKQRRQWEEISDERLQEGEKD